MYAQAAAAAAAAATPGARSATGSAQKDMTGQRRVLDPTTYCVDVMERTSSSLGACYAVSFGIRADQALPILSFL
jgi:hypothetical protein